MVDRTQPIMVTGRDGRLGWIYTDDQPSDRLEIVIRLENGQNIVVPADLLVPQEDGSYYLPMSQDQFGSHGAETEISSSGKRVIPVITEQAVVSKRVVETGKVRIHKRVNQRNEVVNVETVQEQIEVERVPVDRFVDEPPQMRQEGDTLIIPVVEEVLVVEKRLMLKEEVRVKRVRSVNQNPQTVTLRSEEVLVERE